MFGRKSWTSYHPDPTVETTHRTTRSHSAKSSGLMNRLRPRRNTPPTYTTHNTHNTHSTHTPVTTTTSRRSHGTKARFGTRKHARPARNHHSANTMAGQTAVPHRKPSLGDKMSGAMMKLRGSLTGRPGVKGAGTRRMHGTDGRATRRYY